LEAEQAALRNPTVTKTAVSTPVVPVLAEEPAPSVSTKSVVEQIDELLQGIVAQAEEFNGRSLHIIQNPAGGVSINVDGAQYSSPDAVEDILAKGLVKKALKQWESA
jgi:hypothetical protein